MKILIIFVDMIRANRLSTVNLKVPTPTPLDLLLQKTGGTLYTNSFSPGPDTPRAMATFLTGKSPQENGCNTRIRWPKYFLNPKLKTVFDLFIEKQFEISCFSNPDEREVGIFSSRISDMKIHNKTENLETFLDNITLANDHFVFIGLPDFHWALDDYGYTPSGEKKAFKHIQKSLDLIFNKLDINAIDHLFMFSDHGFKFVHEHRCQPSYMLLNRDRTNTLMLHKQRKESALVTSKRLVSIADIYPTIHDILNNSISPYSLLSNEERKYIIIEDHLIFMPSVNQSLGLWAIVTRDTNYIRTLDKGYFINSFEEKVSEGLNDENDRILNSESSFADYLREHIILQKYLCFVSKTNAYSHGAARQKTTAITKKLLNSFFLCNIRINGFKKWIYSHLTRNNN